MIRPFIARCTEEQRASSCCFVKAVERARGAQNVSHPHGGTARYPVTMELRANQAHHPTEDQPAMNKVHVLHARVCVSHISLPSVCNLSRDRLGVRFLLIQVCDISYPSPLADARIVVDSTSGILVSLFPREKQCSRTSCIRTYQLAP